ATLGASILGTIAIMKIFKVKAISALLGAPIAAAIIGIGAAAGAATVALSKMWVEMNKVLSPSGSLFGDLYSGLTNFFAQHSAQFQQLGALAKEIIWNI